jgi:hypothetical protein
MRTIGPAEATYLYSLAARARVMYQQRCEVQAEKAEYRETFTKLALTGQASVRTSETGYFRFNFELLPRRDRLMVEIEPWTEGVWVVSVDPFGFVLGAAKDWDGEWHVYVEDE